MQRRWHYLVAIFAVAISVGVAGRIWAGNSYKTNFINNYCQPGMDCNVYWPLDETSGTTLFNQCPEICGAGTAADFDMTTSGSPTLNQPGASAQRGSSIEWASGSTQYAEAAAAGSGTGPGDVSRNWTEGCWVKPTGIGADEVFFSANHGTGTATNDSMLDNFVLSTGKYRLVLREASANGAYLIANSTTTLVNGTWYFLTSDFRTATQGATLWVNGTQEDTQSPIPAETPTSINYYDFARQNRTNPDYFDGNLQDCFIVSAIINVKNLYTAGTVGVDDWPYNVLAPRIPSHRDDGWFDKMMARGYVTGLFTSLAKEPMLFGPYPVLAIVPAGNIR